MAPAFTPLDLYRIVATAYQLGLAALLLGVGRSAASRIPLALILGMSAFQTANVPLRDAGLLPQDPSAWGYALPDPLIVLTTCYLLSQAPTPIGGTAGARHAKRLWIGACLAWPLTAAVAHRLGGGPALEVAKVVFHAAPFVGSAALIAFHVIPRWIALAPGPLRAESLLLGAGLSLGVGQAAARRGIAILEGAPLAAARATEVAEAAHTVLIAFFALALARLALAKGRGTRDGRAFLALLLVGPTAFLLDHRIDVTIAEFATEAARPLLVAVAVLRLGVFEVPRPLRAALVPATVVAFALTCYLALVLFMQPRDSQVIDPLASVIALVAVTGGALLARRPLARAIRASAADSAAPEKLERYRLAVERERSKPDRARDSPALAALRSELGVSEDEHDVLVAILDRHVIVPTPAIRGAQPGETIAGRFEIARELGRGGFGRALLAKDRASGDIVVLKEALRPWDDRAEERKHSLDAEMRAAARVRSPRVARVREVVSDGYNSYLVRDYVAGRTLDDVVKAGGPLDAPRAIRVTLDVLEGLAALHDAGLAHRDLKPANVVLDEAGRAVLIDCGAARALPGADGASATATAGPAGTAAWMAPEQLYGGEVDGRADVYGAGMLLAYLATGEVASGITQMPSDLAAVVARATARDVAARFAGAREMTAALRGSQPLASG